MTVKRIVTPYKHIGLSTDTKPTHQRPGATFYEYDTDLMKITYDDGTNWVLKKDATSEAAWMFGRPELSSSNTSVIAWVKGHQVDSTYQKSPNTWLAWMDGRTQNGIDYAAVNIPVNELPVTAFDSALWSYYMASTETMGVNIVIWIHDPTDFDKRAEVTQNGTIAGLEKASGWNAHELNTATVQMFYYGENTTGCDLTAGTNYAWTSFQDDDTLGTWTIYRISLEYGWQAGATDFDEAYLADVQLNGQTILLGPTNGRHRKTVTVQKTMIADAKAADDVLSENASTGTDWDFKMGGTGYITKAVVSHDAAITTTLKLLLFSIPPTGETDDNKANTSPVTADQPYFLGSIDFPAMTYHGTGDAYSVATPSTSGNIPLAFDSPMIYGILITTDGVTTIAEALTISLTADMED